MAIGILKGLIGILFITGLAWILSNDRRHINWSLAAKGIGLQVVIAILVLKVPAIERMFDWAGRGFVKLISFTQFGNEFLFKSLLTDRIEPGLVNFAFNILPTIIFFSAVSAILYYFGILQLMVKAFAWIMKRLMKLSGAESLSAAGNIFLGQTESPLLVRHYIANMTRSELMCLMTGGMATIAGGVLTAYITYLGGDDPELRAFYAKHLLTASIMSAPAAVVASKILIPETEPFDERMEVSKEKIGSNVLEAISNGTSDGLKLAINVGAMLLVFTALIYFGNYLFFKIGECTSLNEWIAVNTAYAHLSFQMILGYLFAPIAWLIGVDAIDMVLVGQLLGEKTILNEFYAYKTLGEMLGSSSIQSEKSIIITTYILCGFSNFASIGIQIGGIGALAPNQRVQLSKLGLYALVGGTLACLYTAAIVGMLH